MNKKETKMSMLVLSVTVISAVFTAPANPSTMQTAWDGKLGYEMMNGYSSGIC
ncbi:MAG: hypothetical protein KHY76_07535 [Butyricicoccus pullicaecorum]|nr:hypothetical protein [Butyricicoccus pullicaecorum]